MAADATLTLPFELARRLLVDGDSAAGMRAYLMGRMQMVGDVAKLAALPERLDHVDVPDLWRRLSALTDWPDPGSVFAGAPEGESTSRR